MPVRDLQPVETERPADIAEALAGDWMLEAGGSLAETFMKDDRKNDWLARQMREEERILRRGDLMDLGASHAAGCDAELLKKYHLYAEHDDSVDNGEY